MDITLFDRKFIVSSNLICVRNSAAWNTVPWQEMNYDKLDATIAIQFRLDHNFYITIATAITNNKLWL